MKKFLLFIVMSVLVTLTSFAHHLDDKGWCSNLSGRAFFVTVQFSNNLNVEVQYKPYGANGNTPWQLGTAFTTPASGSTATIFNLPQPVQSQPIRVRFRYKSVSSSNWSEWSSSQQSGTYLYVGCGTLPVKFNSFEVQKLSKDEAMVSFEVGEATDVKQYEVKISTDSKTWRTAAIIFPDDMQPNRKYSIKIKLK